MKFNLPTSTQNWISLIGVMIALIGFFMIIFLFTVTTILETRGSYIGLVIYIILPAIMVTGLILIPIGMLYRVRQARKNKTQVKAGWPKIDLNDAHHRNAFIIFLIGTTIFLFMSAIGSYEAFHFSESVTFCGTICHEVMKPEYTAYQASAHARVACVDCHVGSGADWYVRSKLSGLYQIYAVLSDNFPRPIETPITNLRPAQETCEECHWPQKFYSRKLRQERHYLNDEGNSEWDVQLAMKIGAEYSALGLREGIHWHINPDIKVEFISQDERLETIEWIRYTNLSTGEIKTYQDPDNPIDPDTVNNSMINTMDCMDCHNRPSHHYRPPYYFINEAITAGKIPIVLPAIKALAMEICSEEFETTPEAADYIETTIQQYYDDNYPQVSGKLIETGIAGLKEVYFKNIFPEMKVRWDAYPNFIGHVEFNGCFRCHDDRHESRDGFAISRDCGICHAITAQGPPKEKEYSSAGKSLEFKHPSDIDEMWKEIMCVDCHTGLSP